MIRHSQMQISPNIQGNKASNTSILAPSLFGDANRNGNKKNSVQSPERNIHTRLILFRNFLHNGKFLGFASIIKDVCVLTFNCDLRFSVKSYIQRMLFIDPRKDVFRSLSINTVVNNIMPNRDGCNYPPDGHDGRAAIARLRSYLSYGGVLPLMRLGICGSGEY